MRNSALFIRHTAKPGKRDEVRRVWEKYVRDYVAGSKRQLAYFYCYDDNDPDMICVFQLYTDQTGPQNSVEQPWYPAYEAEVSPLLTGESEFRAAAPLWIKGAA